MTKLEQKDLDTIIEEKVANSPKYHLFTRVYIDIKDRILEGDYILRASTKDSISLAFSINFMNCKVYNVTFDYSDNIFSSNVHFESCDIYGYFINSKKQNNQRYFSFFRNCIINDHAFHSYGTYCECEVYPPVPFVCPEKGAFVAYKVVLDFADDKEECSYRILKLIVPEDAKRSSGFGRKCRCSKALASELYDLEGSVVKPKGEICSYYSPYNFAYTLGEMAYPDGFDDDRYLTCSNGIHFFMSFDEAVDFYNKEICPDCTAHVRICK